MSETTGGRTRVVPRHQERYRLTVAIIGFLLLMLGLVDLAAWIWQIASILSFVPGTSAMALTTACCFTLSGAGLICSTLASSRARTATFLVFSLAAAMTAVRLIEVAFLGGHVQIIEHFLAGLFVDPAFAARIGGSMASNTAIIFFVATISLALAPPADDAKPQFMLELVGYLVVGLGLTALAGYVTHTEQGYRWGFGIGMAVHTAIGVVFLGLAMVARSRWLQPESKGQVPIWVPAAICLAGLLVDLYTPFGLANGMLYLPLILTSLWFGTQTAPFSLAFACSALILLGFLAGNHPGSSYWEEASSRAITVATLWLIAIFVFHFHRNSLNLSAERTRFDAITQNTPNAMVATDERGVISLFNPAAEAMFGFTASEALDQNVKMLMPEPYHSAYDRYLRRYGRTRKQHVIEITRTVSGRKKDGSLFHLDLSVSTFTTGSAVTFVAILRDVTLRLAHEAQLKKMVGQLQAYTADLERSNADLDEFAYIASHDLKEPLRGMHNHSRFLLEDYEDQLDEDGVRRLNRIVRLSQRMEKLVNDLLYFSRIGRQQLAVKRTDVTSIVKDVVSTMELYLEERKASVVIEEPLPAVTCDALRLTEVYRNLITNGVKYNDKAAPLVTIGHLDRFADKSGKITRNVFFVRDNGKGIPQEFYEDIFRIFKRLEKSDDSDDGTGAGLTFVRKIIARHRGDVWLDSEVGQGTTFYFTLGHKRGDHHATA